jgi:hypothetical protein
MLLRFLSRPCIFVVLDQLRSCPNPWCRQAAAPRVLRLLGGVYAVVCGDCSLVGPGCSGESNAKVAWNTRATDPLLRDARDHLLGEAERLEALWSWQVAEAAYRQSQDRHGGDSDSPEARRDWELMHHRFGEAARALTSASDLAALVRRLDAALGSPPDPAPPKGILDA